MKKCPYCAEEIQDDAIVCPYCGRYLLINLPPEPIPPTGWKSKIWVIGLLSGILLAMVVYAWQFFTGGQPYGLFGILTDAACLSFLVALVVCAFRLIKPRGKRSDTLKEFGRAALYFVLIFYIARLALVVIIYMYNVAYIRPSAVYVTSTPPPTPTSEWVITAQAHSAKQTQWARATKTPALPTPAKFAPGLIIPDGIYTFEEYNALLTQQAGLPPDLVDYDPDLIVTPTPIDTTGWLDYPCYPIENFSSVPLNERVCLEGWIESVSPMYESYEEVGRIDQNPSVKRQPTGECLIHLSSGLDIRSTCFQAKPNSCINALGKIDTITGYRTLRVEAVFACP